MSDGTVALLVDFENIRISLQRYFSDILKPHEIAAALRKQAASYGSVIIARSYIRADFGGTPMGSDFQSEGYTPVFVVPKRNGQDRSDIEMSMDGQKLIYTRPDISSYVLASGDGDFSKLASAIVEAGRRLVVIGVAQSTSRELIALGNPFAAIDKILPLHPASAVQIPEPTGEVAYNWEPFIRQLALAEAFFGNREGAYVGFSQFTEKWLNLPQIGPVATLEERRNIVNAAVGLGIAESNQLTTRDGLRWVIKLNRKHPLVQKTLSTSASTVAA
jgi:uncharacterized LabA/DUF88 family protein